MLGELVLGCNLWNAEFIRQKRGAKIWRENFLIEFVNGELRWRRREEEEEKEEEEEEKEGGIWKWNHMKKSDSSTIKS